MKRLKWLLIVILFPIILAYPTWHYFLKDKFYLPGPIFSTPDDSFKNVLKNSNIIEEVHNYKIVVIGPALSMRIKGNRYVGPEGYSFQREKLYIGLLKNILEINNEKLGMMMSEDNKSIFIYPKNKIEKVN